MEMRQSDLIMLEGMRFYAYHGVNPEEQALGQLFIVDVELQTDLRRPGKSDELSDTVNYSSVYKRINAIVTGSPRKLIEAVAHDIAVALLEEFPVRSVEITVRKPEAPLKGAMLKGVGVRIARTLDDIEDRSKE